MFVQAKLCVLSAAILFIFLYYQIESYIFLQALHSF